MELKSIRCTELGMVLRCPLQLWHLKTTGAKPPGWALTVGTSFHKGCDLNFKAKAKTGKDIEVDQMINEFDFDFENRRERTVFGDKTPAQAKEQGRGYIKKYRAERCPQLTVASNGNIPMVEYPINFKIKGGEGNELEIRGTVDLMTKSNILIDHKTAGRAWVEGKELKEIQPYIYSLGMKTCGHKCDGFEFSVVNPKGVQVLPVPVVDGEVNKYLQLALKVQKMFETETFLPSTQGWWCSAKFCGWHSECSFGNGKKEYSLPTFEKRSAVKEEDFDL